jgi:hypothetical protein
MLIHIILNIYHVKRTSIRLHQILHIYLDKREHSLLVICICSHDPRRNKLNNEKKNVVSEIFRTESIGLVFYVFIFPSSYCCFTLLAAIKETLVKSLIYSVRSAVMHVQGSQLLPPVRAAVARRRKSAS